MATIRADLRKHANKGEAMRGGRGTGALVTLVCMFIINNGSEIYCRAAREGNGSQQEFMFILLIETPGVWGKENTKKDRKKDIIHRGSSEAHQKLIGRFYWETEHRSYLTREEHSDGHKSHYHKVCLQCTCEDVGTAWFSGRTETLTKTKPRYQRSVSSV